MSAIRFHKYHALSNDFIVLETTLTRINKRTWGRVALNICDRNEGVGADGIILLSKPKRADFKFDVFNADGGWAELSGNGVRIAALHLHLKNRRRRNFSFETATGVSSASVLKTTKLGWQVSCDLGEPDFLSKNIPVKVRSTYMINQPIKVGPTELEITAVSTGNPHAVLFVDHFDFDWPAVGHQIEHHRLFPNRTNVEFVKVMSRSSVIVAEWERGAGATGSSGTGAAAVVAAGVVTGHLNRKCKVDFSKGTLRIHWRKDDGLMELSGPVAYIGKGEFNYQ
ncbi:MAG: diaminopimelate epimerase [bacterium]|nr:diaminopimelate epimerase [bacterium]